MERGNVAGSLPQQLNQELLVCRVCFGQYDNQDKMPKVLTCSHTFCQHCITVYLKTRPSNSKMKFPCPLCRQITNLTKEGVAGLPHNYTILELIVILDKDQTVSEIEEIACTASEPATPLHREVSRASISSAPCTSPQRSVYGIEEQGFGTSSLSTAYTPPQRGVYGVEEQDNGAACCRCHCPGASANLCEEHLYCQICYVGISHSIPEDEPLKCPLCMPLTLVRRGSGLANWTLPRRGKNAVRERRPLPINPAYMTANNQTRENDTTNQTKDNDANNEMERNRYQTKINHARSTESKVPVGDAPPRPKAPPRRCSSFRNSPSRGAPPRRAMSFVSVPRPSSETFASAPRPSPDASGQESSSPFRFSPPQPPARRSSAASMNSVLICCRRFGRYSEESMQTMCFKHPSQVALSLLGDIVVVDSMRMNVQVFTGAGEYRSMFKVTGVQGCCFITAERLAIATHRGVSLYDVSGKLTQEINIGNTVSVTPYNFGFIACKQKSLFVYSHAPLKLIREVTKVKTSKSPFKRGITFLNISDVAVTSMKKILVLDSGRDSIFMMDDTGLAKTVIRPSQESCGPLQGPRSLTVDSRNNIYVSDTGHHRVLRFSAEGRYHSCLLDFSIGQNPRKVSPHGLAFTDSNQLVVLVHGDKYAEVRFYQL